MEGLVPHLPPTLPGLRLDFIGSNPAVEPPQSHLCEFHTARVPPTCQTQGVGTGSFPSPWTTTSGLGTVAKRRLSGSISPGARNPCGKKGIKRLTLYVQGRMGDAYRQPTFKRSWRTEVTPSPRQVAAFVSSQLRAWSHSPPQHPR